MTGRDLFCALCERRLEQPSIFYEAWFEKLREIELTRVFGKHCLKIFSLAKVMTARCDHIFHSLCLYTYRTKCVMVQKRYGRISMRCPYIRGECQTTFDTWSDIVCYDSSNSLRVNGRIAVIERFPKGKRSILSPRVLTRAHVCNGAPFALMDEFTQEACNSTIEMLRKAIKEGGKLSSISQTIGDKRKANSPGETFLLKKELLEGCNAKDADDTKDDELPLNLKLEEGNELELTSGESPRYQPTSPMPGSSRMMMSSANYSPASPPYQPTSPMPCSSRAIKSIMTDSPASPEVVIITPEGSVEVPVMKDEEKAVEEEASIANMDAMLPTGAALTTQDFCLDLADGLQKSPSGLLDGDTTPSEIMNDEQLIDYISSLLAGVENNNTQI